MSAPVPDFLPEVQGHHRAKSFLVGVERSGRIPPGFVFYGGRGRGKAMAARAWARRLFCKESRACGSCSPCRLFDSGNFADFSEIGVEEGRTWISIDRVRELRKWFSLAPFEADRRIAIIDDAHMLTEEAQNSLLKLLEEPPGKGLFILVTPEAGRLLETIHSRLQRVHFGPLDDEEARRVLLAAGQASGQRLDLAVSLARGSVGRASELLEDDRLEKVVQLAHSVFDRREGPFGWSEKALGGGGRGRNLRGESLDVVDVAIEIASRRLERPGEEGPLANDSLRELSSAAIESLIAELLDARRRILSMSTPRLVFEAAKIKLHRVLASG